MNPTELDMIKQEMLSYGIEGLTEDLVPLWPIDCENAYKLGEGLARKARTREMFE